MPLIYSNGAYALVFAFFFLAWCSSELVGPARWQGSKKAQRQDRGSTTLLAISAGLGVFFFFVFPLIVRQATIAPPGAQVLFFAGAVVVIGGTALRWMAIRTLGKNFTGSVVIEETQSLVSHGLYKYLRHPSYTGILLVVFGLGLMMGNFLSLLAITLGLFIGLLYRIRVEEVALCRRFGHSYKDYMAVTKRLIPFLF
jgi:protein-S-isoprenylcysteine O-methyltransferase Ste14